jgi:hypothetical protein
VDNINGYIWALDDIMEYLKKETRYDPAFRMIDSVPLIDSIGHTTVKLQPIMEAVHDELKEAFNEMAGVNLNSDKVKSFLKEQTNEPDDLKDVFN